MVVKYFHFFLHFPKKNHTIMKVEVLSFLTVSSGLGLPIVCKFEEWTRFHTCQIVPDLSLICGVPLYKKKNLNII